VPTKKGLSWRRRGRGKYRPGEPHKTTGTAVIAVWDSWDSTKNEVYARLQPLGWPGVAGVFTDYVQTTTPNRLTQAHVAEMGNTWDIVTHSANPAVDWSVVNPGGVPAITTAMLACREYLRGLGVRGWNIIAPSGGLYADSWTAAQATFTYVVLPVESAWTLWPLPNYLTHRWISVADVNDWDTVVKPDLDWPIGRPDRFTVVNLHRVVAAGAVGTQVSVARLVQTIAYIQAIGLNVGTFSDLEQQEV
jgi:hypothetical protein